MAHDGEEGGDKPLHLQGDREGLGERPLVLHRRPGAAERDLDQGAELGDRRPQLMGGRRGEPPLTGERRFEAREKLVEPAADRPNLCRERCVIQPERERLGADLLHL